MIEFQLLNQSSELLMILPASQGRTYPNVYLFIFFTLFLLKNKHQLITSCQFRHTTIFVKRSHKHIMFIVNINGVLNSSLICFSYFHIVYLRRPVCVKTFRLVFDKLSKLVDRVSFTAHVTAGLFSASLLSHFG